MLKINLEINKDSKGINKDSMEINKDSMEIKYKVSMELKHMEIKDNMEINNSNSQRLRKNGKIKETIKNNQEINQEEAKVVVDVFLKKNKKDL
jgi:hypothetical protein